MGNIRINASGKVTICYRYLHKSIKMTRSNNILPLIGDVIARSLGGFNISKITSIKVYNQGLLLAEAPITDYAHTMDNVVRFATEFSVDSFNGDFDSVALYADSMGRIAQLDNITGQKTNTEPLSVTWELTIVVN